MAGHLQGQGGTNTAAPSLPHLGAALNMSITFLQQQEGSTL